MKKSQFQFEARKTLLLLLAWWIFRTSLTDWNTVQTALWFKSNLFDTDSIREAMEWSNPWTNKLYLLIFFYPIVNTQESLRLFTQYWYFWDFWVACVENSKLELLQWEIPFFHKLIKWLFSLFLKKNDTESLYLVIFLNTG